MTALRPLLAATAALALPACASLPDMPSLPDRSASRVTTEDVGVVASQPAPEGLDPIAQAAFWGTRYDRNPSDPVAAVAFSAALRATQNEGEALRVMSQIASRAGNDPEVALEMGKALIANDRAFEATRHIETALANGKSDDWSAYSALGVAYDEAGRHDEARVQYDRALALNPSSVSVLNNKGLSYALSGDAAMAERTLRAAASLPGGTARVRQNLALVLGFSGKTAEAEMLARADLPPQVAAGNAAYYRTLVAQPAYWGGLTSENADLPVFEDEAPVTVAPSAPAPAAPPRNEKPVPAFEPIKGEPAVGVGASLEPELSDEAAPAIVATAAPEALGAGG